MHQDDLLAAALDNSSGGDVDMGRAALAFDDYPAHFPGPLPQQSYPGHIPQDFQDYLSDDSNDSLASDLSPDELQQLSLAQQLNNKPVHGFPVPSREAAPSSYRPMPPDVQDQPDILSQLELARQRLSARPPTSSSDNYSSQGQDSDSMTEGTVTSSIRTSRPYRRTVQVTESTGGEDRDAPRDTNVTHTNQAAPAGHSTSFLLLVSFIIAIVASLCTATAVIAGLKYTSATAGLLPPLHTVQYVAQLLSSLSMLVPSRSLSKLYLAFFRDGVITLVHIQMLTDATRIRYLLNLSAARDMVGL